MKKNLRLFLFFIFLSVQGNSENLHLQGIVLPFLSSNIDFGNNKFFVETNSNSPYEVTIHYKSRKIFQKIRTGKIESKISKLKQSGTYSFTISSL